MIFQSVSTAITGKPKTQRWQNFCDAVNAVSVAVVEEVFGFLT